MSHLFLTLVQGCKVVAHNELTSRKKDSRDSGYKEYKQASFSKPPENSHAFLPPLVVQYCICPLLIYQKRKWNNQESLDQRRHKEQHRLHGLSKSFSDWKFPKYVPILAFLPRVWTSGDGGRKPDLPCRKSDSCPRADILALSFPSWTSQWTGLVPMFDFGHKGNFSEVHLQEIQWASFLVFSHLVLSQPTANISIASTSTTVTPSLP